MQGYRVHLIKELICMLKRQQTKQMHNGHINEWGTGKVTFTKSGELA